MIRLKHILLLVAAVLIGWVGWGSYFYFFDKTLPGLSLLGLQDDGYYCGDIQCAVSSNKPGEISVWLDGQPLINKFKLAYREQEHPFAIPTKTITNGKHVLKAEFTDATFRKNNVTIEREFNVENTPLQAAFVKPDADYKVFQGRTLHLQFQVNKEIKEAKVQALANTYPCFPESKNSLIYESYIPISCEENPNEYLFSIEVTDKVGNTLTLDNKFQVVMYPFKKQTITVSDEKIKEEKELAQADNIEQTIEELTKNSLQEKLWRGAFCAPIDITRVTCEFGTVRTTQQKGRYAHRALDVINAPKSVVWATQNGVVALKDRFGGSGNTVIVDHGMGILSLFFHLEDFANISVGQKIAKGNPIGTIGKTGYATGYHLHWEMRVNGVPVDPMQWTKAIF